MVDPTKIQDIKISRSRRYNYNLDALFIATNAPGRSAFNPVERRMAPLSRQFSGVILPHDHFGFHLDANGKTVDIELEKKNFQKAGETLAEIFSNTIIDNYPVYSKYVNPEEDNNYNQACKQRVRHGK